MEVMLGRSPRLADWLPRMAEKSDHERQPGNAGRSTLVLALTSPYIRVMHMFNGFEICLEQKSPREKEREEEGENTSEPGLESIPIQPGLQSNLIHQISRAVIFGTILIS